MNWKEYERSCRSLISGTLMAFTWGKRGKPPKTSVRIPDLRAGI
jgi:hypothetical protein